jgi:MULE transposase domain.
LVFRLLRSAISQHASVHLARPETLVFLSDRQKGLIEGVDIVFPDSPHGYCLRHLYDNLHKKFKHKDLQRLLYKAAKSPTVQEFDAAILEMRKVDNDCVEWLLATADKKHWAEAYFPGLDMDISRQILRNRSTLFSSQPENCQCLQ